MPGGRPRSGGGGPAGSPGGGEDAGGGPGGGGPGGGSPDGGGPGGGSPMLGGGPDKYGFSVINEGKAASRGGLGVGSG